MNTQAAKRIIYPKYLALNSVFYLDYIIMFVVAHKKLSWDWGKLEVFSNRKTLNKQGRIVILCFLFDEFI